MLLRRLVPLVALVAALALPVTASADPNQPAFSYPALNGPLTINAPIDGTSSMSVEVTGFRGFCFTMGCEPHFSHDVRSATGWNAVAGNCDVDGSDVVLYHCGGRNPNGQDHPSITNVNGSVGPDTITGFCSSGRGLFLVSTYSAVLNASGQGGDDVLDGSCGADTLNGGDGDDAINGLSGHDQLTGGTGLDDIDGGSGNDTIAAGSDRDSITAGSGNDSVDGGDHGDRIDAGSGDDGVTAGGGSDYVLPGVGTDTVDGGEGRDTISYEDRDGSAPVTIRLDGTAASGIEGENDTLSNIESVIGSPGADAITGNALANVVDAGAGDDSIDPQGGSDIVEAGDGNDTISLRDGVQDTVDCGGGTDTVTGDEFDNLANCETANLSRELMADVDNDGVALPTDCNDHDATVRPGLPDKPGDGIDQDCLNGDAPFPRVLSGVTTKFRAANKTKVLRLDVYDVAPGAKIQLRCKGKKCFKGKKNVRVPAEGAGQVRAAGKLRKVKFRPRQRLELRILVPDQIGKVVLYKFKRRDLPSSRTFCMPPGAKRPQKC